MPRITKEVHRLVCTDAPQYESHREKLRKEGAITARVIVLLVSNTVAVHAGLAPALCVPLVAVLLAAIAKASVSAWCIAVAQQTVPANVQQPNSAKTHQMASLPEDENPPKAS
jgi:hypothetical protein